MSKSFTLKIAGLERQLPIVKLSPSLSIASFVLLGDAELVRQATPLLVKKLPPFDVIITAEAKGIPLAQQLANELQYDHFVVARKSIKAYMKNPFVLEVNSITTSTTQILCLDSLDVERIKGKRVAIIDDVISTGESIQSLEQLITKAGGQVVCKAALLAEGDAALRKDIIFLEKLPLFVD
ncbi:phosphoribosyltransferase family protein [Kurthia sibirica]|uniref:Adenine phosphoribosyltransferase n=1 Tax=Kurthia sibirica TaxID=202750 RepID=A0A2U3AJ40_9BACL|nr:phosphoribosyltransferase family protein [Kurthia sibirica]PWI24548.1 adenine phosphoribosyltransferase [Kurthia sibirica]